MSHDIMSPSPAPATLPCTAPTTGASSRARRVIALCNAPMIACSVSSSACTPCARKLFTSPPPQNRAPAPVSSTARTDGSASIAATWASSALASATSNVFTASGRLSVRCAIPSRTSSSTASSLIPASPPEHVTPHPVFGGDTSHARREDRGTDWAASSRSLVPWTFDVDARLCGQPENALADNVALDLVGTAANRDRRRGEEQQLPLRLVGEAFGAEQVERKVRRVFEHPAPPELGARPLRSGRLPGLGDGTGAARGQALNLRLDVQRRQPVAHARVGGQAARPRQLEQSVVPEPRRGAATGEAAALVGE